MSVSKIGNFGGTSLQPKEQIFTSSGTWTVPYGVNSVKVTCIGAGAAIGGAGGVAETIVDTSAIQGTGIPVVVGTSPAPGTYGAGGGSSFGPGYIQCGGGFPSDNGVPGMSGTTYVNGVNIQPTPVLSSVISAYGAGDAAGIAQGIVYNPVGGFYMTRPTTNGVYYTSTNGTTWTRRTGAQNTVGYDILGSLWYANGKTFYGNTVGGYTAYYVQSTTDGITWTSPTWWENSAAANFSYGNVMFDIVYLSANSTYYAVGNWNGNNSALSIYSSTTGTFPFTTQVVSAYSYTGNTQTTKMLTNGTNQVMYFYLDTVYALRAHIWNGTTWTPASAITGLTAVPTGSAWDGSKYVVTDTNGTIYTSTNQTTWTYTGTTIPNLKIQGYTSSTYYGNLNGVFAYSTNLTTWTTIAWQGGALTSYSTVSAGINGLTFIFSPSANNGLIGTFVLNSQNTQIAPGYNGTLRGSSGNLCIGGGAGGEPVNVYAPTAGVIFANAGPGVKGYGVSLTNSSTIPPTYGSTNGFIGQQGAVILEWWQ